MLPGSNSASIPGDLPDPRTVHVGSAPKIPVTILTGFLGSGKTTLIRRFLASSETRDTAVIVNEFGEIGIDHHLVEAAEEDTIVLPGGCLCCAASGNLAKALRSLLDRRERRELPPYRRVIIETSGLADPTPLVQTFLTDPIRLSAYHLRSLIAVIDGISGVRTIREHAIARKQLTLADRLLVTKIDLIDPGILQRTLESLEDISGRRPIPLRADKTLTQFIQDTCSVPQWVSEPLRHVHSSADYDVVCRRVSNLTSETKITQWLKATADTYGADIVRIKGLMRTVDGRILAVNSAQHCWSPPRSIPYADLEEGIVVVISTRASGASQRALASLDLL